jgi:hypothetical protein
VAAANLASRYALFATIILLAVAVVPHAWHVRRTWRDRRRGLAQAPVTDAGLAATELATPEP